jgi:hypothetical protein
MNIRQALLSPVALAVLAALAGAPAGAQDTAATSALAAQPLVGPVTPDLVSISGSSVSIRGIVSGKPESVSFSGVAQIQSRLARDPDFGKPSLLLTIDLSSVSGVGSSTDAKYVISSQENVQRPLASSLQVEITFPFVKSGMGMSATRTGVASFVLDFDLNTGAITTATGHVASPTF